jgi:hypothetical protein
MEGSWNKSTGGCKAAWNVVSEIKTYRMPSAKLEGLLIGNVFSRNLNH